MFVRDFGLTDFRPVKSVLSWVLDALLRDPGLEAALAAANTEWYGRPARIR
jgi:hypothetical protein